MGLGRLFPRSGEDFSHRPLLDYKHILTSFKNDWFLISVNMDSNGMVALLDCCEDGVIPYMIFFKDGLEMEKCEQTWL